ncbi:hypothetical protein Brsp01_33510 [Brucella sp. NBRC 12950]|jgi:hypothetical protein|nr:hypothetical protein Brsp01_33510 [Brucella sp. NBRC 12950]
MRRVFTVRHKSHSNAKTSVGTTIIATRAHEEMNLCRKPWFCPMVGKSFFDLPKPTVLIASN